MPKKDRTTHVSDLLPNYDAGARLCYFYDLLSSARALKDSNKPLAHAKKNLYNEANQNLTNKGKKIFVVKKDNKNEVITSAIEFLEKVAENERRKEVKIAIQYKDEIANKFKGIKSNEVKKMIEQLDEYCTNPTGFQNNGGISSFYKNLALCINLVRQEKEDLEERINQILATNRKNMKDLSSNYYVYRAPTDIDGILKNAIGIKASEKQGSLASLVQRLIIDYVTKNIPKKQLIEKDPVVVLSSLMIDFMDFLQKQFDRNKTMKKLDEIDEKSLKEIFEKFIQQDDELLKTIKGETDSKVQALLDLSTALGIRHSKTIEEIDERNKELKKKSNRQANYGKKTIIEAFGRDFYNKYIRDIRWRTQTGPKDIRAGILYEIIKVITDGGNKVRGSAAIDRIYYDIATLQITLPEIDKNLIDKKVIETKEAIEQSASIQRKDRFDDQIEQLKAMNNNLAEVAKEIDNILDKYDGIKDLFIYHESLKLYARLEEHKMGKEEGLKGRNLTILNALDRIYSLAGLDDLKLLDKDVLYSIAINLPAGAIAQNLKGSIENYLSMFAGMLMFDDIANMGREIVNQTTLEIINTEHVKQIHLYLINDIYYPGSIILTYIADALKKGYNKISSSDTAMAEIDTSEADSDIATYLNEHPYGSGTYNIDTWEKLWKDNANKISSHIKVQIYFLASFITFLRDFQEQLQAYN